MKGSVAKIEKNPILRRTADLSITLKNPKDAGMVSLIICLFNSLVLSLQKLERS